MYRGQNVGGSWPVENPCAMARLRNERSSAERPGVYYGQCNQICGVNHPFMPIEIDAVSKEDFVKWAAQAKQKFSRNDGQPDGAADLRLAAAH